MGAGQISFGPFLLDRGAQTLLSGGKPVALGQRAFALLDALAAADGPVDKAALIEAAWPGTIVEDGNLTVQIAALRKALGTRADGQDWIVTVPRVGYRLLREVAAAATSAETSRGPALAVLPFQNMSGDVEQDYFADGVVEDIITGLSRFSSIGVVSRNSSFVYKGRAVDVRTVARELGVDYVLEGSVRKGGNRLRVTAQLIEARDGVHLWARSFDGTAEDVFDMQDRITEGVVGQVEPRIQLAEIERARRERPQSVEVYDLYLRALQSIELVRPESNLAALEAADAALAIDPDYAPAMALAAHAREHRVSMGWPAYGDDDAAKALELAHRALELAGNDPMVCSRCGVVLMQVGRDYERAIATLERAVAINPFDPQSNQRAGIAHMLVGNLDKAVSYYRRSLELAQDDAHTALTGLAHIEVYRGNLESAIDYGTRALGSQSNFNPTYWVLITANVRLGRMDEAVRLRKVLQALVPDLTISRIMRHHRVRGTERHEILMEGLRQAGLPEGDDE